ncbi:MAG: hypothetical protein WAX85_01220 [Minisyncoccia bacterium]
MKVFLPFIIIGVCIGMYYMYINPTLAEIKSLKSKKAEYDSVLAKSQDIREKRDLLLTEYANIPGGDLSRLNKLMPETFNAILFINDVNIMASRNAVQAKDFKVNEAEKVSQGDDNNTTYKISKLAFSIEGRYNYLKRFLTELESSLQLVDVVNLSVKHTGTKPTDDLYTYSLEVYTYSLK